MFKTKIPLDRIYRVFFAENPLSDSDGEDSDSSPDVATPEVMNDYTVIKLGDKPVPVKPPIPKYPKYDFKIIRNEAPSMYYSSKIQLPPEDEYVPPPRQKPRDIIPENFQRNKYKRELCGKSCFEQDKIIIKYKQELYANNPQSQPDPNSIPPNKNAKPPKMYYKEEEQRRLEKEAMDNQLERELRLAQKQEERRRRKFEQDAEELKRMKIERHEQIRIETETSSEERRIQEEEEREIIREKWKNFVPDRPTRASQLKDESCRRKLEREQIEERRHKLNAEMRREMEKEQMKRLEPTLLRLKPSDKTKQTAEKRRKEMQKTTRLWNRWLKLTEQDIGRQTMLERICEEQENMQYAREQKAEALQSAEPQPPSK